MVKNDPSKPPKWAKFWPKISIFWVIYKPLELKIHPKVDLLRSKTMPKHFLNNSKTTSKNSRKRLFWPTKCQKWPSKPPKWAKIWPKISIFGVIYQPFELKIQPKVGLLRSKTMPKHFLNNTKKTAKKSRKRFYFLQIVQNDPQNRQNEPNFDRKFWFSG